MAVVLGSDITRGAGTALDALSPRVVNFVDLAVMGKTSGLVGVPFFNVLFAAALVVGVGVASGFVAGFGTALAGVLGVAVVGVWSVAFGTVFGFGAALGLRVASGFAVLFLVCRLFGSMMKPYLLVLLGA